MRLSEGLINSEVSLDQQMQLTEEEDLRNLLMIGGIQIFLPHSPEEAKVCVADEATTTEVGQLAETVRKKNWSRYLEAAQAEEEDEHSEEWLNIFSQETEKTAALELAEVEEEEEVDNISLADLYEQIEALERRVIVQGMHIQQVKLEADEEGMGDHSDLPNCRKFLQLERLHEQGQPLEQLDEVIEEIRELMLGSAETVSKEKLSRRKEAVAAAEASNSSREMEQMNSSRNLFGIQEDFNS
jgi:hypothetical protein